MQQPKVHILYEFVNGPWGGANQFLSGLRSSLEKKGFYSKEIQNANIVIVNSNPSSMKLITNRIYDLKVKYPNIRIINRVDGPVKAIRGKDGYYDKSFSLFDNTFADGTIFQSQWSKSKLHDMNLTFNPNSCIIQNGADQSIFSPHKRASRRSEKIRIVSSSWSPNPRKGFKVYQWLDSNLDFSKYEYTFIGNSPIKFRNIKVMEPLAPKLLGDELKKYDLYITASQSDPCSNSLIEALSCGLKVIGLQDGGHTEIINKNGRTFRTESELLELIECCNKIPYPLTEEYSLEHSVDKYVDFFRKTLESSPRIINKWQFNKLRALQSLIELKSILGKTKRLLMRRGKQPLTTINL